MIHNKNYISEGTVSYLTQQFPNDAPNWLNALPGRLTELLDRWKISFTGHEKNSRFGTILYGESERYGSVAVKVVPSFSPRLKSEILCYRLLPYKEMCPLYDVDETLGAMLLKYVPEEECALKSQKADVFASLYEQRKPALENIPFLFDYEEVVKSVLLNAYNEVKKDARLEAFIPSIQKAEDALGDMHFEEKYIIHGDAHEYNMLGSKTGCVLIDPLGYIAPFSIEFARYLGTAMKDGTLSPDGFFRLCEQIYPAGCDLTKNLAHFAVDTTLRACNTFIEGNTFDEILFAAGWAARAWDLASQR